MQKVPLPSLPCTKIWFKAIKIWKWSRVETNLKKIENFESPEMKVCILEPRSLSMKEMRKMSENEYQSELYIYVDINHKITEVL